MTSCTPIFVTTLITSLCFTGMFVCLFVRPNFKGRGENVCGDEETEFGHSLCSRYISATLNAVFWSRPSASPAFVNRLYYGFTLPVCVLSDVGSENRTTSAAVWGEDKKKEKKKISVAFNDFCLLLALVWTPEWRCARTCCYGNPQVVLLSSTCFFAVSALLPASISRISMRLALCGKWVMWALSQNRLGSGSAVWNAGCATNFASSQRYKGGKTNKKKEDEEKKWEKDNRQRWRIKEEEKAVLM